MSAARADVLRRAAVALALLVLCAVAPAAARAQEPAARPARTGLDRLQLSSVGATYGVVKPTLVEPANVVGLHADYGALAPSWRLVFGLTYWSSRYTDAVVQRFEDSLSVLIDDPTGDATVDVGRVRTSLVALTADARWSPLQERRVRPYLGGGIGGYALNAEGRGISGTFVEQALDQIAFGLAGMAGTEIVLLPNFSIGMQARYDLLSGTRFGTLRAGASYLLRPRSRE